MQHLRLQQCVLLSSYYTASKQGFYCAQLYRKCCTNVAEASIDVVAFGTEKEPTEPLKLPENNKRRSLLPVNILWIYPLVADVKKPTCPLVC